MVPHLITDKLLDGCSLRVILHPHPQVQDDFPEMIEALELPHITVIGDRFFAKTSNSHAISAQFKKYDLNSSFSYAYSNFYNFVVNCNHKDGFTRIISKYAYKNIIFEAVNNFKQIWSSKGTQSIKQVEAAILNGHRIKIALLDKDNIWNIHPIHMPSFYVEKNFFELFTEQDSMPEFFRNKNKLEIISKRLESMLNDHTLEKPEKNFIHACKDITLINRSPEFISNYYTARSKGSYLHGKFAKTQEEPEQYDHLKVFSEVL